MFLNIETILKLDKSEIKTFLNIETILKLNLS